MEQNREMALSQWHYFVDYVPLKMKALRFYEISRTTCQQTRRNFPEAIKP
jgi:hypothetical protein